MKVALAYCYPLVRQRDYYPLAERFARTLKEFPAGYPHELHVIANGRLEVKDLDRRPFQGISCHWHSRDNSGWDIGAFQYAAEIIKCDLLVCLGANVHFYQPGWLDRMVEAYANNGLGLYGCWGYTFPLHIRTTAFWLPPELMLSYPNVIGTARTMRYDFEHGPNSITRWTLEAGLRALVVSWTDAWDQPDWGKAKVGLGDCLCLDQHTHK